MTPRCLLAISLAVQIVGNLHLEAYGQSSSFPYTQNFDSVALPALPSGWASTRNISSLVNDFTTTNSIPHSPPHAVISTNATIAQELISPLFDFSGSTPDSVSFYTRRSGSHIASVVVEASLDSGRTYNVQVEDTLTNPGSTAYVHSIFNLPSSFASSRGVKFRWRVIPAVSGTGGTFRIDNIRITAQTMHDLALTGIRFVPVRPAEGDSVEVVAVVRNVGVQVAQQFSVDFYVDVNNDSIPQASELVVSEMNTLPLAVSDSVDLSAPLGVFSTGEQPVIAKVVYALDQTPSNDQAYRRLVIGYPSHTVVINEIMYAPTGTEPEWIELYNTRSDSISLRDWLVSDSNVGTKRLVTSLDIMIPPTGYVVLTRDSADLLDNHPMIQSRVINVAGFPTLNNTGDAVVVYDNRIATMDSVSYVPVWGGNTGGRSLERVDPFGPSTLQPNWGTSRNPSGSTPGARNSLSQKDHDLELDSLFALPAFPVVGDSLVLFAQVHNRGTTEVDSFDVFFYEDANSDSLPQQQELLATIVVTRPLDPLDSLQVTHVLAAPPQGLHSFIVSVQFDGDEDTTNNSGFAQIVIGFPAGTVRINEIMYDPAGEPEWVEIQNMSTDSIDLQYWSLSDQNVLSKYPLSTTSIVLAPSGYAVVTKDSALLLQKHGSIPGLVVESIGLPTFLFNNDGDAVVLFDNRGLAMDSVHFFRLWGGTVGRSLERVDVLADPHDSTNWKSSVAPLGSSPGRKNSVSQKDHDLVLSVVSFDPPFPILGDSVDIISRVLNVGLFEASSFSVQFFEDLNGDSIAQTVELLAIVPSLGVLLSRDSVAISIGTNVTSSEDRTFISRIIFQDDEDTTNNIRIDGFSVGYPPGSIRINEIMYAPPAGIPEWAELLNVSSDTIDLRDWRIGNRTISSRYPISRESQLVQPSGFVVVTKDSALMKQAYPFMTIRIVQSPMPTFLWNNNGDAVALLDNRGGLMDSVFYRPGWGGISGVSLERIDALGLSTDSTNWASSVDSLGGTPGKPNSIVALDYDLRSLRAADVTVLPGSTANFSITVQNVGKLPSTQFNVLLYHDINRDSIASPNELFEQVTLNESIARRESLVVNVEWAHPPSGQHTVIAVIDYPQDMRFSNNTLVFSVRVGFGERTLVINEIMFAPLADNAEYVEVFNASDMDVDVAGWKLTDRPNASGSANEFDLATAARIVHPGELFVLASDSSLFSLFPDSREINPRLLTIAIQSSLSLNNDGDGIALRDGIGLAIDSVAYIPDWHNPGVTDQTGRSLEKIHPSLGSNDARSWSTSAKSIGGTPGRRNSIYSASLPPRSRLSFSPNPFSPDGDGVEDFTIVHYELPLEVSIISMKIYDVKGRLIRRLANNEPSGSQGDIVWDGRDDETQKARIGIYVVLLEAINDAGGVIETAKAAVVLAARL